MKSKFGFGPLLTIDYKGIRGDASDNIPGVPGVGEGSAVKLVATYGPIEKIFAAIKKDGVDKVAEKCGVQKRFVALVSKHEEEAMFSKMLATIRRDAPIDFRLPDRYWKESIDVEATLALFSELGFRSLAGRFRQLMSLENQKDDAGVGGIPAPELAEGAVLLWLLESDRTNATAADLLDYGRSVFKTTERPKIKEELETEVKRQGLWEVFSTIDKPLLPVIDKMNQIGIKLDIDYLKELSAKFRSELGELESKIHEHAGAPFNINSPKQLGDVIYDRLGLKPAKQKKTAGGARSTRESELRQMADDHPIIDAILRYRELSKLVSTYVDALPKLVGEDGRVRTTFLPTGTVTGRVGSRDPNLQNIPIRTEDGRAVRGAFVADPGFVLVSIDYSQIELRIAAILSGDEKMIEIFKEGQDVHSAVASRVFGVLEEEVTPDMRRKAKVINFGILYGMGVNALRGNLGAGTSREEAQEFLNAYFNTFTRLAEYLEETKQFAREHGYTETMFGRRRYLPDLTSDNRQRREMAERMALNAPIQGTAADIMKIAMLRVEGALRARGLASRILLQVHDELVLEIAPGEEPAVEALVREAMGSAADLRVALDVSVGVGRSWHEAAH